jgi:hypothetical protein
MKAALALFNKLPLYFHLLVNFLEILLLGAPLLGNDRISKKQKDKPGRNNRKKVKFFAA